MNPYIANTADDMRAMLQSIGVRSVDDLFSDIKEEFRPRSFNLPEGRSEQEVVSELDRLARKNAYALKLFIGGGYYDHYIPAAVTALMSRGEFLTAYTPYQPECSQGTLQALYEFQSLICALTRMEIANASLYDGGTALYEAMMMAVRITGKKRVVLDGGVSPIYRKIIRSYTNNLDIALVETPVVHGQAHRPDIKALLNNGTAAVILQNPNFFGAVDDFSDIVAMAGSLGVLTIASVYPASLGLLKPPGDMGVDIVTGEGQSLGLPLHFGGPYLGFMATSKKYMRKMPGRIVGQTVDRQGRRCFVNTLQAREQHIRREKATSNICTNEALCAIQAAVFMSLLGPEGMKEWACLNFSKAEFARKVLEQIPGVEVKRSAPTFNEFTVCLPKDAQDVVEAMIQKGFAAGFPLGRYYPGMDRYMIVAVTEKRTRQDILQYAQALREVLGA
ncbi:MAG TPA: aminomethyl-transferring glycine dehydrogenase subunit GcvPA [Candidatus Omnitrophota bacterium]|nr:aminomethyl-transferring glycine dehydrogenase subunit GcvPA [Candidatus Omnitrophota bacterium]HPN55576.1 aminomethyl-transferring glycine dehydrogenase subunit GcvPA [Candidatus Omnitrophota bacterium]